MKIFQHEHKTALKIICGNTKHTCAKQHRVNQVSKKEKYETDLK